MSARSFVRCLVLAMASLPKLRQHGVAQVPSAADIAAHGDLDLSLQPLERGKETTETINGDKAV